MKIIRKIIKMFFNKFYRFRPPEMVSYWKHGESAKARVITGVDGSAQMEVQGEKYTFPGFPRGHVLERSLKALKFLVKQELFNNVWAMLEDRKSEEVILKKIKSEILPHILAFVYQVRYDMLPVEKMCPAMRELWRAMTVVEDQIREIDHKNQFGLIKKGVTFFLQEDDAYRFRLQWMAKYINPNHWTRRLYRFFTRTKYDPLRELSTVSQFLKNAEILDDMKGRIVLIERIFGLLLKDKDLGGLTIKVFKEINWKKLYLSKADRYFFRGKYFKVDHEHYDY
jgi:hypothetical protein